MHKSKRLSAAAIAAVLMLVGIPLSAKEDAASMDTGCELHLWATAYVPASSDGMAKSTALVSISPANYADPHSSASLLDARQRIAEIDEAALLRDLGLDRHTRIVAHTDSIIPLEQGPKGKSRISESKSPCYMDFMLRGISHSAGKQSFSYRYYFRDFGNDNVADLSVQGAVGAELWSKASGSNGTTIDTAKATREMMASAAKKIRSRLARRS